MKNLFFSCFLLTTIAVQSQEINIIPKPTEMTTSEGSLALKQPIGFIYNDNVPGDYGVSFLKNYLKKYYKISQFKQGNTHSYGFATEIFVDYQKDFPNEEGYELIVDKKAITVRGNEKGLFYAFQTLIQLLPVTNQISQSPNSKIQIPFCQITDYPRFAYRGMHLDCGRHFFSVDFIKKYIDFIALHKMNYFHWHLTEDQGWRIEIKKYPKLTQTAAWRNGTIIGRYPGIGNDNRHYGGYYTQEQIKEIVKYAADRYITVVPEIEMPGHSSAAIASYPELSCFPNESTKHPIQCAWNGDTTGKQVQQEWGVFDDVFCAGKENTFSFLQDVMDEVMALFPSKYIHVGGDECPKNNWKRCPDCQKRIKDEGLKDEHELQSYFIQRMEKYLNSKGRTLIGWDEILEGGLAPKAVVMSWRGEQGGINAARQNHDVIMTPGGWCYFDHSQSENEDSITIGGFTSIEKVYSYNPVPDSLNAEQGKHILGAQGNVWTEYMSNDKKVEYMIFPRMSALSEVLWSKKENIDWNDFEKRLTAQFKRYDLWEVNYSKAYFDLKTTVTSTEDNNGVLWKLESKIKDSHITYMNEISPLLDYTKPILIKKTHHYSVALYSKNNQKLSSISQKFFFNIATGKKITLTNQPSRNYSGDGAFTLINGIENEKGLAKSKEFLGFLGTDCEAIIDLGTSQSITNVSVHVFQQTESWIYRPQYVEIFSSADGKDFISIAEAYHVSTSSGNGIMEKNFNPVSARYVKVLVKNWGNIPEGNPGAGNKAWLFVDEIEVNAPNP